MGTIGEYSHEKCIKWLDKISSLIYIMESLTEHLIRVPLYRIMQQQLLKKNDKGKKGWVPRAIPRHLFKNKTKVE